MIAIDTDLLVYAHRAGCPEHAGARRAIEEASNDADGWGIPSSCVFEFWSVVTHPASTGGGSSPASAKGFIEALMETAGAVILPPPQALVPSVTEIWTHDAGFVALPGLKVRDPLAG